MPINGPRFVVIFDSRCKQKNNVTNFDSQPCMVVDIPCEYADKNIQIDATNNNELSL